MKKYNIKSNQSCRVNYAPEILDIWCQGNKIVAYVEGTYIYKTIHTTKVKRESKNEKRKN